MAPHHRQMAKTSELEASFEQQRYRASGLNLVTAIIVL